MVTITYSSGPADNSSRQRLCLGDLVRARRDLHLGDGHAHVVDHRREQRELTVLVIP
jgi:hypothetical protein